MKTRRLSKKNSLGRKALILALAFMMIMQFNCLTVASAWADTDETAIAQNEILQEEGKIEEAPEQEAPAETEEIRQAPEQEEITETAELAEAPEQEIQEEALAEIEATEEIAEQEEIQQEETAAQEAETAAPQKEISKAINKINLDKQSSASTLSLADQADGKLTVHITNILYINRTRPESSVDGKAVPWEYTFTISKNGSKAISHNGTYSYVGGATASASGQGFKAKFLQGFVLATPISGIVRGDSLDGFRTIQRIANTKGESVTVTFTDGTTETFYDEDIYISPVYSIEESWVLYYNAIDLISTGSGSWSNENGSATSYTKIFKDPSVGTPKEHYRFLYWYNTDKDQYFMAGEKDKYTNDMFKSGEKRTVNVYALWQPSVTVNYSVLGNTVKSIENFEGINVYDYTASGQDENIEFTGWFDEEGNRLSEDAAFAAPAITGLGEKADPEVHTVYAGFNTKHTVKLIWDDQNREDSLRAESIEAVLIENGTETEHNAALNEENEWTYTFTGLEAYDADHSPLSYTAEEIADLGTDYDVTIDSTSEANTTIITNTFRPSITLTAASDSWTFDGEEHSNSEVTLTSGSLYEGDELIASAAGTVMNAKDSEEGNNIVAEYKIFRGEEDVTDKYNITLEAGSLEIVPAPIPEEEPEETPAARPETPADDDDDEVIPAATTRPAAPQEEAPAADPAAQAEPQRIENALSENAAPKAAPAEETEAVILTEEIAEEAAPTSGAGTWALLNLVSAAVSAILSLTLLALYFTRRDDRYEESAVAAEGGDDEDSKEWNRKGLLRVLSLIPAIASIVIFILTEDMSLRMVMTDKWTALMIVLLAVTALLAILSRKTERNAEEA